METRISRRCDGGWRTGKSDGVDFKSTHRRTLFNVSLTFLTPPPPPQPPSFHRRQMGRELKQGVGWEGGRRRGCATLRLDFIQGHQPQTKSRVRVHGRASQWGGGRVWAGVGSGFTAKMLPLTVLSIPGTARCTFEISLLSSSFCLHLLRRPCRGRKTRGFLDIL